MISSLTEFAFELGLNKLYLENIIARSDLYYKEHFIKKKNGQDRRIASPNYQIKAIQIWVLRHILETVQISQKAHGFVKKRGIRTNAQIHCTKQFILCMDIHEFFPSVKIESVRNIFTEITGAPSLAELLSKVCCYKGALPQGGVTSPYLSNIFFNPIDDEIEVVCSRKAVSYSRYADDLTFSTNNKSTLDEIKALIPTLVKKYGLSINQKKTRIFSGKNQKIVTGLFTNSGRPTIGRMKKRLLRSMLHHKIVLHDENVNEMKVLGHLSFLKDIERSYFYKTKKYIERLKASGPHQMG